jgi:uncharacterized membrane protein (DUF2068 family)
MGSNNKRARRTGDDRTGAGFKLVQGLLLVLVGTGLLLLVKSNPETQIASWLSALQIDTDSRLSRTLLSKLDAVNPPQLQHFSIGAFLYAALLFTEGTGLLLRKRWAEFMTVIVTASFLPLELHEVVRRVTWPEWPSSSRTWSRCGTS